jgi:hypothetical protein
MERPAPQIDEGFAKGFLAAISSQLGAEDLARWRARESNVRAEAQRLADGGTHLVCDAQSAAWVGVCSVILASYRDLCNLHNDPWTGLTMVREALMKPFREGIVAYIQERFGITQEAPDGAFERISENFKRGGESRFGSAFKYVQAEQDESRSFTNIEKCLFHDFCRANSAPELTPLLCALDNVWADELSHPKYGIRFERPTTLAEGQDACRFQFTRIKR